MQHSLEYSKVSSMKDDCFTVSRLRRKEAGSGESMYICMMYSSRNHKNINIRPAGFDMPFSLDALAVR